jgi:hypothetical protein
MIAISTVVFSFSYLRFVSVLFNMNISTAPTANEYIEVLFKFISKLVTKGKPALAPIVISGKEL